MQVISRLNILISEVRLLQANVVSVNELQTLQHQIEVLSLHLAKNQQMTSQIFTKMQTPQTFYLSSNRKQPDRIN